jgi:glycosyltransferase involved in cell wall biosynthesis
MGQELIFARPTAMKVVHLVAGAGGMYCGSCLHGNTLVGALRRVGCDAVLLPMYTPLRTEDENRALDRIAFGGINVFLQQTLPVMRRTPWWLDRLWDRPRLLRWVARLGGSTRPERLGALTVSMLQGERGHQRKELDKLIGMLTDLGSQATAVDDATTRSGEQHPRRGAHRRHWRPDVVHLNNGLLLGIAGEVRRRLGVPVICSLTGEDVFLERLPEPWRTEAWSLMAERAADCDGLIAMNGYFARAMAERLGLPPDRIDVVPPGIVLDGYPNECPRRDRDPVMSGPSNVADRPIRLGVLSRICHEKGTHLAAEAVIHLAARTRPSRESSAAARWEWEEPAPARCSTSRAETPLPGVADDLPPVELHVAGYLDPADRAYLDGIRRAMRDAGLADRLVHHGEPDREGKLRFYRSVDLFCLPTVYRESKGLPVYEAWAAGLPVVLPRHGAFPEMADRCGGAVLHEPHDSRSLAEAVARLIADPAQAAELAAAGHRAVHAHHGDVAMAERMMEVYRRVAASSASP